METRKAAKKERRDERTVSKEYWQKTYTQCVLDHHNKKYSRNITILARCEEIHPALRSKPRWDWSAMDKNNNGREIAIEVKRLTNPRLQEKFSALHQICRELSQELSGKLRGIILLFIRVWEEHRFDLQGDKGQQLKDTLKKLILKEAQSLEVGKWQNLSQALRERLPDIVPKDCSCNLYKLDHEGSYLSPHVNVGWWAPVKELQGEDLEEFHKLLQSANQQLGKAKARGIPDTFLIIIEIWFSGADAEVLQNTLRHFDPSDYPHVKFFYLVGPVSPPNVHELFFGK